MLQAEAGTEVAESSWCPTPAHTPSRGQADMQTQFLSPTYSLNFFMRKLSLIFLPLMQKAGIVRNHLYFYFTKLLVVSYC
jgi:hypothetical protein